jgi:hypothetical protein
MICPKCYREPCQCPTLPPYYTTNVAYCELAELRELKEKIKQLEAQLYKSERIVIEATKLYGIGIDAHNYFKEKEKL